MLWQRTNPKPHSTYAIANAAVTGVTTPTATDISHAINGGAFPNGFEKVEHGNEIYFVEKENPEDDNQ